ncbi:MAG: vWA domain-containing protein [Planctomycetota bacterium]
MIALDDLHFAGLDARLHLVWILGLALALALFAARRRRGVLTRFGAPALELARIRRRDALKTGLFGLGGVCALLALLQPRANPERREVSLDRRDLVVCLDVSRSMLAEDVAPNRLERAKLELAGLARALGDERIGLVAFAGEAAVACPLTPSAAAFEQALQGLGPEAVAVGGSHLGDALRKALGDVLGVDLANPEASRGQLAADLLVITDGEDQESYAVEAATLARRAGVGVFVLGLGGDGAEIPLRDAGGRLTGYVEHDGQRVRTALDGALLAQVAQAAERGAYLPVGTKHVDLARFYADAIAGEEGRALTDEVVVYDELYQPLLALALALFAASWLLPRRETLLLRPLRGFHAPRRPGVGVAAAAALACAALAPAQAQESTVAAVDSARGLRAGLAAAEAGDLEAAAAAFQAGEGALCAYDAAWAHKELGDPAAAIPLLEPLSAQSHDPALADAATRLLASCHEALAEARIAEARAPEGEPAEREAALQAASEAFARAGHLATLAGRTRDAEAMELRRREALAEVHALREAGREVALRAAVADRAAALRAQLAQAEAARDALASWRGLPPREQLAAARAQRATLEDAARVLGALGPNEALAGAARSAEALGRALLERDAPVQDAAAGGYSLGVAQTLGAEPGPLLPLCEQVLGRQAALTPARADAADLEALSRAFAEAHPGQAIEAAPATPNQGAAPPRALSEEQATQLQAEGAALREAASRAEAALAGGDAAAGREAHALAVEALEAIHRILLQQDPQSQDQQSQDPQSQDPQSQDPQSQDQQSQGPQSQGPQSKGPQSQDPRDPQLQDPQDAQGAAPGEEPTYRPDGVIQGKLDAESARRLIELMEARRRQAAEQVEGDGGRARRVERDW